MKKNIITLTLLFFSSVYSQAQNDKLKMTDDWQNNFPGTMEADYSKWIYVEYLLNEDIGDIIYTSAIVITPTDSLYPKVIALFNTISKKYKRDSASAIINLGHDSVSFYTITYHNSRIIDCEPADYAFTGNKPVSMNISVSYGENFNFIETYDLQKGTYFGEDRKKMLRLLSDLASFQRLK